MLVVVVVVVGAAVDVVVGAAVEVVVVSTGAVVVGASDSGKESGGAAVVEPLLHADARSASKAKSAMNLRAIYSVSAVVFDL